MYISYKAEEEMGWRRRRGGGGLGRGDGVEWGGGGESGGKGGGWGSDIRET